MPKTHALLLDLDGTVADTHELIFRCFNDTIRKHLGRDCRRPAWERSVGLPLEEMFAAALADLGQPQLPPELLAASYRAHLPEIDHEVTSFPELPQILEELKQQGVRLAIVTTKHEPAVSRHLRILGLSHLFDAVISGDQCLHCKPHPEPFSRALAALDVRASSAVAVGDSPYDIVSARAAGIPAAAACWGTTDRAALLSALPDRILEQPRDLLDFLAS